MDDGEIREAIDRAKRLVEQYDEPYRLIGFRVLLEQFLGTRVTSAAVPLATGDRQTGLLTMTLNEFVAKTSATTHKQRILAMIYHRFKTTGEPSTVAELTDDYQSLRVRPPKNFSDTIGGLVRGGLVVRQDKQTDGGTARAWVVTPSGEQTLENSK